MPSYTWIIERLDCYADMHGQSNVVFSIHWRLAAKDGECAASIHGSVGVAYSPDQPFIAYPDLAEDLVVGWVQDALGADRISQMEAHLAANIATQMSPPVVYPPLPWG